MNLNASQERAVFHRDGPMLVLAGPGSGKTLVITCRVKELVESVKVPPSSILVVTFTKAAAQEMRQRFLSMTGGKNQPVSFGTFHAVFFTILKAAYNVSAENIASEGQRLSIVRGLLQKLDFAGSEGSDPAPALLEEIGSVKGSMIDIGGYYSSSCAADLFRTVFREYHRQLRSMGLIDFEDMMTLTLRLFQERPDVLGAWQRKFRYILIDEFQDINPMQYKLIRMLAAPENNIFAVGDDDQSIYSFRGARPGLMLHFSEDFPGARMVFLGENYRCQAYITASAGKVISRNQERFAKEIIPLRPAGKPVDIRAFGEPYEENETIAQMIRHMHEDRQIPYGEIAVLFRTNTQARMLLEKLSQYNIPFRMQGTPPILYRHWIARDIFSYIRIAQGSRERKDYLQILNRPNRYISRDMIDSASLARPGTGPQFSLGLLRRNYEGKRWMQERLDHLARDLQRLSGLDPFAAVNFIRKGMDYDSFLEEYAGQRGFAASELLDIADELAESGKPFGSCRQWFAHIEEYTREMEEKARRQREEAGPDSVSISTMHHAKGLEYQVVFLPDVNEGLIPHRKALLDTDIEEERRMFYVAMTRAKDELYIFFACKRYGRSLQMSRFLTELME